MINTKEQNTKEQKLNEIRTLLNKLYCFTSEQVNLFLEKSRVFPEAGLDQFIKTLQEGKAEQDTFLSHKIEENKEYTQELDNFLRKTTVKIKNNYEQIEQSSADSDLKDI